MNTPLASKTTVSSRNKMAAGLNNHIQQSTTATTAKAPITATTTSRLPPRTTFKQPFSKTERTTANLAATSSRIALSRSRLSGNSATSNTNPSTTATPSATIPRTSSTIPTTTASIAASARISRRFGEAVSATNHRLPLLSSRNGVRNSSPSSIAPSFANSRSSSKLSSISSSVNNNNVRPIIPKSNYIPDTNTIRKGLAKFSNPIECQRQFQTLNSQLRELTDINENKEKTIVKLQDQLKNVVNRSLGYAVVVQYFSNKLKIGSEVDLETECEQLKSRVNQLIVNEREFDQKLDTTVNDYKIQLKLEQDLRAKLESELEETRVSHSNELVRLNEVHEKHSNDLEVRHSEIKEELDNCIQTLKNDLNTRTKELHELRKEYDSLNLSFSKLEESLTRDKDARVKYAQEKANQLQKDVDSLNSVLEMRTERIHVLEKDSILLSEVQQELMKTEDSNKALKQQLESLTAALENKRIQYENLLADHEKIAQDLKRERKERRRMTMRTEQLEYVLNESCTTENNLTVLDSSVET